VIFVGNDGLLGVEPIHEELDVVLAGGHVLPAAVGHRGQAYTMTTKHTSARELVPVPWVMILSCQLPNLY